MDSRQQRLAHRLIASGLSSAGYATACTIMGLENVLDALEGWRYPYPGRPDPSRGRDPQMYFLSVFGDPDASAWGWRLGGHHLSLNYTIVGEELAVTPMFFGAHPAATRLVGPADLRPLAGEEDLARQLLVALPPDQRAQALASPVAPDDVVQSNRPKVETGALPLRPWELFGVPLPEWAVETLMRQDEQHRARLGLSEERLASLRYPTEPNGVCAADLGEGQRVLLAALLHQYFDRLPAPVAARKAEQLIRSTLEAIHFSWAGGTQPGEPHYYRVQGPCLLIEYDNTQDVSNHVHSVMRDPEGDFGADLLARRHRQEH